MNYCEKPLLSRKKVHAKFPSVSRAATIGSPNFSRSLRKASLREIGRIFKGICHLSSAFALVKNRLWCYSSV